MSLAVDTIRTGAAADLLRPQNASATRSVLSPTESPALPPPSAPSGATNTILGTNQRDTVRIGFGNGTVSGPTAALTTLSRTVKASRNIVESLNAVRAKLKSQPDVPLASPRGKTTPATKSSAPETSAPNATAATAAPSPTLAIAPSPTPTSAPYAGAGGNVLVGSAETATRLDVFA